MPNENPTQVGMAGLVKSERRQKWVSAVSMKPKNPGNSFSRHWLLPTAIHFSPVYSANIFEMGASR